MLGYLVILLLGVAIGFVFGVAYGMGIVVQRVRDLGRRFSSIHIDDLLNYLTGEG